ncbi:GTP cyclohydrolase FolE2 [Thermodesulfatator autotrophicus]|uniref:GTP cyclohydrolase FolE2 n=1 Tax=Thermodesulfatator autotrophicus TaxID=1795632 RepID=A0A177E8X1_9BACT|nr:GTP cyclohydrolase FolE2 [Thermodesulfatator autotrophicus]OAG28248.1 GTP cyclohydrolase FolE2 [Thermodesulfatator autotrophicus]
MSELKDVQSLPDYRQIEIDKVGIKGIRYPVSVLDRHKGIQHTIAEINMYVDLPHHFKGTHMSRFVEILNEFRHEIHIKKILCILQEMRKRLTAKVAHIEMSFPFFMEKEAPVSKAVGLMGYNCRILGSMGENFRDLVLEVEVPIMTVCPCSKEISAKGAHNQRGIVRVKVRFKKFIWIEELIEIVEKCASSPVYPLLKRTDEKFVTEWAYDHPMFVEDVVREVCSRLTENQEITWFSVEAENFESIHAHNAYAFIERNKN